MSKRALVYARVSYDDRKNEARNLEGQIEDGRAYCQERGYRIVAELAEDDRGASGASWDLPMLSQALDIARAGECDVLVTRELDRFARGLAKQLVVESEFKRRGVDVEYILAQYDNSPEGKLNKHIRAVIAEFEREKITQRMSRGKRQVVRSGKIVLHGDKPPYGYCVEDRTLVIYEPEARIVRLIFTWYVYGDENGEKLSIRGIAKRLTKMKVPTWADTHNTGFRKKRKYGEWSTGAVDGMLKKELYKGTWFYGKTNSKIGRKPRESWIPVEVPAIIDDKTWRKAQERRAYNREMSKRNRKYEYLVGRRVTCQCGTKMGGNSAHGKLYYYCQKAQGRLAEQGCDAKYFRADMVDAAVWEKVKEWLLHPEALRQSLEETQTQQKKKSQPLRDRLAVVDDLLADNCRQLEKLLDLYLSGDFDKEMLTERKTRLETTIAALEREQGDLLMTLEAQTLSDDQIKTIEQFAREVSGGLKKADTFEKRRRIIDDLDIQVRLVIEDGLKVAYVRWLVSSEEEERVSIESTTS